MIHNADGERLASFDIPTYAKSLDSLNDRLLVATKCGKVIVIDEKAETQKQIMQGHYTG